jgi:hypothetical protein
MDLDTELFYKDKTNLNVLLGCIDKEDDSKVDLITAVTKGQKIY